MDIITILCGMLVDGLFFVVKTALSLCLLYATLPKVIKKLEQIKKQQEGDL
jgi:hypothetical protein